MAILCAASLNCGSGNSAQNAAKDMKKASKPKSVFVGCGLSLAKYNSNNNASSVAKLAFEYAVFCSDRNNW